MNYKWVTVACEVFWLKVIDRFISTGLNKLQDYSCFKVVDNYYHTSRGITSIPFIDRFLKVAHIQQQYV